MYLHFNGSALKNISSYKNRQTVSQGICYNEYSRAIWVICVTTAMFLFVYQVADRTSVYFRYNTTVSVNIRYTKSVPFPAVTLCNINTFRYYSSYRPRTRYRCLSVDTRVGNPASGPRPFLSLCSGSYRIVQDSIPEADVSLYFLGIFPTSCPRSFLGWGGTLILS